MIFVLFLAAGLGAGLLRGGRVRHLAETPLHGLRLIVASCLTHAVPAMVNPFWPWLIPPLRLPVLVASFVLGSSALFLNRRLHGVWVMWVGAFLNFIVMAANDGRMPISIEGLRETGGAKLAQGILEGRFYGHVALTQDCRLPLLSDIIRLGHGLSVPSIGDLVIGIGLMLVVSGAMRRSWKVRK